MLPSCVASYCARLRQNPRGGSHEQYTENLGSSLIDRSSAPSEPPRIDRLKFPTCTFRPKAAVVLLPDNRSHKATIVSRLAHSGKGFVVDRDAKRANYFASQA